MILYTTHCPKCNVLKKKLDSKNLQYVECTDTEVMVSKGYTFLPILEVDGVAMDFSSAVKYINEL